MKTKEIQFEEPRPEQVTLPPPPLKTPALKPNTRKSKTLTVTTRRKPTKTYVKKSKTEDLAKFTKPAEDDNKIG